MTKLQIVQIDKKYAVRVKRNYFSSWQYLSTTIRYEYKEVDQVRRNCMHDTLEAAQECFLRECSEIQTTKVLHAPLVVVRIIEEVRL